MITQNRPLRKTENILHLMQVKSIAECSKEHSAILSTFINQSIVIKIFILFFEWLFCKGSTVSYHSHSFHINPASDSMVFQVLFQSPWITIAKGSRNFPIKYKHYFFTSFQNDFARVGKTHFLLTQLSMKLIQSHKC